LDDVLGENTFVYNNYLSKREAWSMDGGNEKQRKREIFD
jgi:hypothetical protein